MKNYRCINKTCLDSKIFTKSNTALTCNMKNENNWVKKENHNPRSQQFAALHIKAPV